MTNKQIKSLPRSVLLLGRIVNKLNAFFDWLYHSKYNPLYRSGTLAIGLLILLIVTGVYLLIFYKIASPYESVANINENVWFGDIVRTIHRYATDAVMITLFFHVIQLLVQGKTWGPRALAWISGVVLLVIVFISAWTGYVMVWDTQGQLLAVAGAEMLQLIPFLKEPLTKAFDGSTEILSSFFFMNLFLHVALPLGIIGGMWIHTARLNRAAWLPKGKVIYWSVAVIAVFSILIPANLQSKADLLSMPGSVEIDWFYNFWLPLSNISPWLSLGFLLLAFVFAVSFPFWCKPKTKEHFVASYVDKEECLGCGQCKRDCPYEAITMEEREGKIKVYSFVHPDLCVSCGTCSASCDDFAIGPEGRTGKEQLYYIGEYFKNAGSDLSDSVSLLVCECNQDAVQHARDLAREYGNIDVFPIGCCGNLHSYSVEELLTKCKGVAIWGCPEKNCYNRLGVTILKERIFKFRHPTLKRRTDRSRVEVFPLSASEKDLFSDEFKAFYQQLFDQEEQGKAPSRFTSYVIKRIVASSVLMILIAYFSVLKFGQPAQSGKLRFVAHLAGQSQKECRELNQNEIDDRLKHMRKAQVCEQEVIDYTMRVNVNNQEIDNEIISQHGLRKDKPYYINRDYILSEGKHKVEITLTPTNQAYQESHGVKISRDLSVTNGKISLIAYNSRS